VLASWTSFIASQGLPGSVAWVPALVPAWVLAFVLLLALWIDQHFGEPPANVHPVVWMGNYLHLCGSVTVRCAPAPAFLLGALAWWVGVLGVGALGCSGRSVNTARTLICRTALRRPWSPCWWPGP
jgi:cobalamin biosynthesis protein CobD/CbiB